MPIGRRQSDQRFAPPVGDAGNERGKHADHRADDCADDRREPWSWIGHRRRHLRPVDELRAGRSAGRRPSVQFVELLAHQSLARRHAGPTRQLRASSCASRRCASLAADLYVPCPCARRALMQLRRKAFTIAAAPVGERSTAVIPTRFDNLSDDTLTSRNSCERVRGTCRRV